MQQLYQYTLLKQDGTKEVLEPCKRKTIQQMYPIIGCSMVEIIPQSYYQEEWGKCTVYGDEEGRFSSENHRNPHTKVIYDDRGYPWDCVGNLLLEEKIKGEK